MEKQMQCRGCGSILQSKEPHQVGYLPEHLLKDTAKALVCQRCYKLIHYGQVEGKTNAPDPQRVIATGLEWADALLVVVDLMDFEASIPQGLNQFSKGKKTVVLVNKIDLLPPRTKIAEAKDWVKKNLAKKGIVAEIIMISADTGTGIAELQQVLARLPYKKWLVIGATSVGKSTLISRMLQTYNLKEEGLPTIARFPGTTIERVHWNLKKGITLSDTPGFVPEGRLLDQLSISCAQRLTPATQLNVRVYELGLKSGLVIPGMASIRALAKKEQVVIIGFTASEVSWQRANIDRFAYWLNKGCQCCNITKWQTFEIELPANYDLVIHGLGWVSTRREALTCEITIPFNVNYSLRPNLIGAKK